MVIYGVEPIVKISLAIGSDTTIVHGFKYLQLVWSSLLDASMMIWYVHIYIYIYIYIYVYIYI